MTFRTLGDALTDQHVTVTAVIKYNNMWRKDTTVTKGRNILWRFSILSSQGTLCDGHYIMTSMTLLFCHTTLFMTNFVLTMAVCLCHTNQFFCSVFYGLFWLCILRTYNPYIFAPCWARRYLKLLNTFALLWKLAHPKRSPLLCK